LTAKQSEKGMVMKTRTMEKKVSRCAQMPGPSSQAVIVIYYFIKYVIHQIYLVTSVTYVAIIN
jgi:hypothetical protein